jgi:hypothetical protein
MRYKALAGEKLFIFDAGNKFAGINDPLSDEPIHEIPPT